MYLLLYNNGNEKTFINMGKRQADTTYTSERLFQMRFILGQRHYQVSIWF